MTPMIEEVAARHDLDLHATYLPYCGWTRGARSAFAGPTCFADQARAFDEVVAELDPDIVFLAHRSADDPVDPGPRIDVARGRVDEIDDISAVLDQRARETVAALRADGRTVVMFEPLPVAPTAFDPLTCLSTAEVVEECRFVASSGPLGEERTLRDLADDDAGVVSVDLDELVCPYLPICDPVVDGQVVRRDQNHITTSFGVRLAPVVDAYLMEEGVFA